MLCNRISFNNFSYDSDKSGAIDKKEMTRVMKSVYAMLGTKGTDKSSLDERVFPQTSHTKLHLAFLIKLMPNVPRQLLMLQDCLKM